jgi:hypothetical protein
MTPTIVEQLRREIRRLSGIRVEEEYITSLLSDEIIKRELVEGEEAKAAQSSVRRMQRALDKERKKAAESNLVLPSQTKESATAASHIVEAADWIGRWTKIMLDAFLVLDYIPITSSH